MTDLNPLASSVSLDDLLKANKRQFDDIFSTQMDEIGLKGADVLPTTEADLESASLQAEAAEAPIQLPPPEPAPSGNGGGNGATAAAARETRREPQPRPAATAKRDLPESALKRDIDVITLDLIENALIYTKAKGLEESPPVEVRVERSEGQAVIEVEDHGLGVAERHHDRIFERFYRVDQGRTRSSGGTGLGLAIVRHVVQNHGGRIEVESVPGVGATFRLLLPTSEV